MTYVSTKGVGQVSTIYGTAQTTADAPKFYGQGCKGPGNMPPADEVAKLQEIESMRLAGASLADIAAKERDFRNYCGAKLTPVAPPPPDSAFIGKGCAGAGMPTPEELVMLRQIERLEATLANAVHKCKVIGGPGTSACIAAATAGMSPFITRKKAELAAVCAAKRPPTVYAPPTVYRPPPPPPPLPPPPPPPPRPPTVYRPPPTIYRAPEEERPEDKLPYVEVAPPERKKAAISGSGLLLAALVVGGAYVGWKVTRKKKAKGA